MGRDRPIKHAIIIKHKLLKLDEPANFERRQTNKKDVPSLSNNE